jgi:hypothetical protein
VQENAQNEHSEANAEHQRTPTREFGQKSLEQHLGLNGLVSILRKLIADLILERLDSTSSSKF